MTTDKKKTFTTSKRTTWMLNISQGNKISSSNTLMNTLKMITMTCCLTGLLMTTETTELKSATLTTALNISTRLLLMCPSHPRGEWSTEPSLERKGKPLSPERRGGPLSPDRKGEPLSLRKEKTTNRDK